MNGCAPGATPLLYAATGDPTIICVAFCTPAETYLGSTANKGGLAPHTCASRGATGPNDECRFWFSIEPEPPTQYSNTLGYCMDHSKYTWDHDMNAGTANVTVPSCTTLSNSDTDGDNSPDHIYWGCGPLQ